MDRYPGGRVDWRQRNETVRALVERGWAHRLMLGHDESPEPVRDGDNPSPEHPGPYQFVSSVAIPALRADGVSDESIAMMLRDAPREFLCG